QPQGDDRCSLTPDDGEWLPRSRTCTEAAGLGAQYKHRLAQPTAAACVEWSARFDCTLQDNVLRRLRGQGHVTRACATARQRCAPRAAILTANQEAR
ncbi:hypothetical protein RZS08_20755, partial [Arthrospira platensis SPKY1]|nr:hypothetical protein [Arthrospira platensis SPKY1]